MHRRLVAVCAGDEDQTVAGNRGRCGNIAAARQLPEFTAGFEVVPAGMLPSVDDDLSASAGVDDGWCPERGHVGANHAPDLPAGTDVERGEKRVLLDVSLHDQHAIVNDRRTRESP